MYCNKRGKGYTECERYLGTSMSTLRLLLTPDERERRGLYTPARPAFSPYVTQWLLFDGEGELRIDWMRVMPVIALSRFIELGHLFFITKRLNESLWIRMRRFVTKLQLRSNKKSTASVESFFITESFIYFEKQL